MTVKVLLVDDDLETARAVADLIEAKAGVFVLAVSTFEAAIQAVEQNPIRVAVLDQRMPDRSGTEMYKQLKKIRPSLKAIMLSGEANLEDVGDALSLGYVKYLHKGNAEDLHREIHKALSLSAAADVVRLGEGTFIAETGSRWIPWSRHSKFYLMSYEMIGEPRVPINAWRLTAEVNSGQTISATRVVTIRDKFSLTKSESEKVDATSSASLDYIKSLKIESKIEMALEKSTQLTRNLEKEVQETTVETLSLPAEPVNPDEQAVKARGFYTGAEYIFLLMRIREDHVRLKISEEHWLYGRFHTGSFLRKQVDILTDGKQIERVTTRWP